MRPRPSLKVRGVQLLAQRDHSRSELRAKLLRHAKADAALRAAQHAASAALAAPTASAGAEAPAADVPDESPETLVDRVLDWLEAQRYLDESRFADSRVHARASRYGNLRIRQELAQHGVTLTAEAAASLKVSEVERARAVWERKFGAPPSDALERARQMRFLAGRGFSAEVVRRVVAGGEDDA